MPLFNLKSLKLFNPIAVFGLSDCNRVKARDNICHSNNEVNVWQNNP